MARVFYPVETYSASQPGYRLLPFRFLKLNDDRELLVNEVGEFVIAPLHTARALIRKQLIRGSDIYSTFKAKQFITDDSSSPLLDLLATKYRTKSSFIEGFTKLHIFVVTLRCDHSCHYCQVSRQTTDKTTYDMSLVTAEKSVELMMKSPARHLTLELQGGEPLLAFDVIRFTSAGVTPKYSKSVGLSNSTGYPGFGVCRNPSQYAPCLIKIQSFKSRAHYLQYAGRYIRRPPIAQRRITYIGEGTVVLVQRQEIASPRRNAMLIGRIHRPLGPSYSGVLSARGSGLWSIRSACVTADIRSGLRHSEAGAKTSSQTSALGEILETRL